MKHPSQIIIQTQPIPNSGETLIIPVFENEWKTNTALSSLDKTSQKNIEKVIKRFEFTGKKKELVTFTQSSQYITIYLLGLGKKSDFSLLTLREGLAETFRTILQLKTSEVFIQIQDIPVKDYMVFGKAIALAVELVNYRFDTYKNKEERNKAISVNNVVVQVDTRVNEKDIKTAQTGIVLGQLIAEGVCKARDLVNEPASHLTNQGLADMATNIAKASKGRINIKILDEAACKKLGMGSYLSVGEGSERESKFVVLSYKGKKARTKMCFIGKSIIFDTGGLSLKPAEYMEDMKIDMAGGAAVLGLFSILSQWNEELYGAVNYEIYGILPISENMPSGKALRPGDIVTAMNSKTIEVLNTDAEGRLTLADALVYAERELGAEYIVDLATLTGSCVVALGKKITGLFDNNEEFAKVVSSAAEVEGEKAWRLPMPEEYKELLKSDIADLKNISAGRYGGAVTAALFLEAFVEKAKWIHLDIAGPAYNDEKPAGTESKGGTGWGVMLLTELMRKQV